MKKAVTILIALFIAGCAGPQSKMTARKFVGPEIDPSGTAQYLLTDPPVFFELIGKGRPVLLIHGAHRRGTVFTGLVKDLSDTYYLIVPDLPGHGLSGGKDYSNRSAVTQIIKVLNSLKIKQADLVGHDLGGQVAQALAAKYPERFTRLVLIQSASPPGLIDSLFSLIPFMNTPVKETYLQKDLAGHEDEKVRDLIKESYRYTREPAVEETEAEVKKFESAKLLKSISQKTLILVGKQDDGVNKAHARFLDREIPDSEIVEIPGGFRSRILHEDAKETAAEIERFLNDKSAA
jgi:pimeloyl-ACP methyl ester carboxylesterase